MSNELGEAVAAFMDFIHDCGSWSAGVVGRAQDLKRVKGQGWVKGLCLGFRDRFCCLGVQLFLFWVSGSSLRVLPGEVMV